MRETSRKRSKSTSAIPDVRLAVTGGPRVGKSAISVRFLTRRFIGEYQHNIERIYRRDIKFGNDVINYDLKDVVGANNLSSSITEWATCIAIIYSITDRDSFTTAATLLNELDALLHSKKSKYQMLAPCTALIANKKDLEHFRDVSCEEGRSLAKKYGAGFWEVSASEDYHSAFTPLNSLIVESYLNIVTAKNTDKNSNFLPMNNQAKNETKPRARSDGSTAPLEKESNSDNYGTGTWSNRSSTIDTELEDVNQRKDSFKKQEEDTSSTSSTSSAKENKKRKKMAAELQKQDFDGINQAPSWFDETRASKPNKLPIGKHSLDSSSKIPFLDSPEARNENKLLTDEEEEKRSNSYSRKDKKRSSYKKPSENKPEKNLRKSRSYSDLKSFNLENNEEKVKMSTPQLTRVRRLAIELEQHGSYKERPTSVHGVVTANALLTPHEKVATSSFSKLSSFNVAPKERLPMTTKSKKEKKKYTNTNSLDENENNIQCPPEEKVSTKLKRNDQKKSVRRKLSSIFRPKINADGV